MHHLFKPCDRLRAPIPNTLTEYELVTDLPDILNEPQLTVSYEPLIHSLEGSVLWLSKRVFAVSRSGDRALSSIPDFRSDSSSSPQLSLSFRSTPTRSRGGTETVMFWLQTASGEESSADESETIQHAIDPFLRLLQLWACPTVQVQIYRGDHIFYASEASFSEFVSAPCLYELELINIKLLNSQCYALGHWSGERKLTLWDVTMSDAASFANGLSRNLGPTRMEIWTMMSSPGLDLLGSFTENSRLQHLVCGGSASLQTENIGLIISALAMNRSLQHLCVSCSVSVDAWASLWKAIGLHPALVNADIRNSSCDVETTCIREYTRVVANSLKTNQTLQKITIPSRHRDNDLWRRLVLPALEANQYRPRFKALWKVTNHNQRDALFAKALASVRGKPHLMYLALNIGSINSEL